MYSIFEEYHSLVNLDLSNFDNRKVNNMKYMFYSCKSLIWLNLSSFNTENVKDMSIMFSNSIY